MIAFVREVIARATAAGSMFIERSSISTSESERIEEGLIQRVRLLEAILEDIYGPQRLLHKGLLQIGRAHV